MNPQKYVVAVSGGVDSMALLHMLQARKRDSITYIVAHYDHGIRPESHEDRALVQKTAAQYGMPFESAEGHLGSNTSEAEARTARYAFLRKVKDTYKADKIITAHHQDDVIETMIINVVRGTGPRGLAPMQYQTDILRPLLAKTKQQLLTYAKQQSLLWHEDSTNTDENYLRNYIRLNITPKLETARQQLLTISESIDRLYLDIDMRISGIIYGKRTLYRPNFVYFPYIVQKEIMRAWLVKTGVSEIDRQLIERATIAAKTLPHGKKIDLDGSYWLNSEKQNIYITSKL